jgi:hypothetical protein
MPRENGASGNADFPVSIAGASVYRIARIRG